MSCISKNTLFKTYLSQMTLSEKPKEKKFLMKIVSFVNVYRPIHSWPVPETDGLLICLR